MNKFPLWLSILIIILIVGFAFWGKFQTPPSSTSVLNYSDCISRGYPILESYPEQCITPDGAHFTNPLQSVTVPPTDGRVAAGYLSGKVSIGPICPVERVDAPCAVPSEMYTSRDIVIYGSDQTTIMDQRALSSDGTYKVTLGPGNYFARVEPAGMGPAQMKPFTITSFETTTLDFDIDTGIR